MARYEDWQMDSGKLIGDRGAGCQQVRWSDVVIEAMEIRTELAVIHEIEPMSSGEANPRRPADRTCSTVTQCDASLTSSVN